MVNSGMRSNVLSLVKIIIKNDNKGKKYTNTKINIVY